MSDHEERPSDAPARDAARARALHDFLSPGDLPEGARLAEAEAALQAALEREIPELRTAAPAAPANAAGPARARRSWWADLWSPRGRLVFATLALVVFGAWLTATWTRTAREPVMRGTPESAGALAPAVRDLPHGGRRLEWQAQPGALDYTVVFVSPDLQEIARIPHVRATHLDLQTGALPPGLASDSRVLWRVIAMRDADELARSATLTVTVP